MLKLNSEMMGFNKNTVRLEWIGKDEAKKFVEIVEEMDLAAKGSKKR